jgi:hypothetical protein
MVSFIIWLIGAICCIWCIKDVWSKNLDTVIKIVLTVALLCFSWIGFIVYYFLLRNRL